MMETAKQVLDDLCHAADLIDTTDDPRTFRVLWVASLTLCRSIGSVLARDPHDVVRSVSGKYFNEWKVDPCCIFNTFINLERNNIVHEGQQGYELGSQLFVVGGGSSLQVIDLGDDLLYVPFADDNHGDLDVRDWLRDAIVWWREQLYAIEAESMKRAAR